MLIMCKENYWEWRQGHLVPFLTTCKKQKQNFEIFSFSWCGENHHSLNSWRYNIYFKKWLKFTLLYTFYSQVLISKKGRKMAHLRNLKSYVQVQCLHTVSVSSFAIIRILDSYSRSLRLIDITNMFYYVCLMIKSKIIRNFTVWMI